MLRPHVIPATIEIVASIYISITFFDHTTSSFPTAVNVYISEPHNPQQNKESTWNINSRMYVKTCITEIHTQQKK